MSSKILFRLEYLALVAYVESIIPLVYAVHLSALYHLPNAKYYLRLQNLTSDKIQYIRVGIAVYTSVEIVTLVWLHVVLKRKFGFSLIYQLAFVLEREMERLQGHLFYWVLLILQLTLVHSGTYNTTATTERLHHTYYVLTKRIVRFRAGMDFTFTFAWMT